MAPAMDVLDSSRASAVDNAGSAAQKKASPRNIQIYLRMRPMVGRCMWHSIAGKDSRTFVTSLPRDEGATLQNARAEYKFRFDGIFNEDSSQEDVFQGVALPVVDDALRGVNGTIFAYGQTGTGKTYTITGGAEAFEMRGIIPRALSRIFEFASTCTSSEFTLAISYLEIYQDRGYDLLDKANAAGNKLDDLKRVYAVTDDAGQVVLRGLSVNPVGTEEEALNLLFIGDANRIVAETPLNDCSTRSHCIFTIWIASKEHSSRSTKRAKLHLVDLAGSERVKHSGTRPGDCVFQEACSINLTLHYLEQVIVALHQKAAGQATHVPYRNSLMTSVLKDSLGGNCRTRMIATVALELYAIQETINTCRFAQAVAQIENVAAINEEEEASVVIERLQRENEKLRGQLQLAIKDKEEWELTEERKELCKESVEQFLLASGDDLELPLTASRDLRSADFCFRIMREKFKEAARQDSEGPCIRRECRESLQKLQLHVEQRDAEIATLLGILHQSSTTLASDQVTDPIATVTRAAVEAAVRGPQLNSSSIRASLPWLTGPEATALLKDRGRAFEILRRSARKTELLEADSQRLHRLYADAKAYSAAALRVRNKISNARTNIEKLRIRKCMQDSEEPDIPGDDIPEETVLLRKVVEWRNEYIKNIEALEMTKRELKRVHVSVERGRKKLQENFESWFNVVAARQIQHTEQHAPQKNPHLIEKIQTFAHAARQPASSQQELICLDKPKAVPFPALTSQLTSFSFTPRGAHPLVTDNLSCLQFTVPTSSMASTAFSFNDVQKNHQAFTGEQDETNPISSGGGVVKDGFVSFPQKHSCSNELDNNEAATKNQRMLCADESCLIYNPVICDLPDSNTYQDSNHTLDPRIQRSQEVYTGSPSADEDIKAFYEATGPRTHVTYKT